MEEFHLSVHQVLMSISTKILIHHHQYVTNKSFSVDPKVDQNVFPLSQDQGKTLFL